MLLSHLNSLQACCGGSAFCSCLSPGSEHRLVLSVCAYLPSPGAAWAPVCPLRQHPAFLLHDQVGFAAWKHSAGLTRQSGQCKKIPVHYLFSQLSEASWPRHFLFEQPSLAFRFPGFLESLWQTTDGGRIPQRASGSQTPRLEILIHSIGPGTPGF